LSFTRTDYAVTADRRESVPIRYCSAVGEYTEAQLLRPGKTGSALCLPGRKRGSIRRGVLPYLSLRRRDASVDYEALYLSSGRSLTTSRPSAGRTGDDHRGRKCYPGRTQPDYSSLPPGYHTPCPV